MNKIDDTNFPHAVCKVKGYRFTMLNLLGILIVFFSALSFFIVYDNRKNVSTQTLVTTGIVCGIIAALGIGLSVFDRILTARIKKKDCVVLFEDGIAVYIDKPKADRGYKHFTFDELQDYGFINIVRKGGSGESRITFKEKRRSTSTYLYADLMNYGYMRITAKDGGYYHIPVGDIEIIRNFMKEHAPQVEEFVYMRIAGIHDDIILPLK